MNFVTKLAFTPQKAGVKLVAKGSAGSRTAPNSRNCSPLPWFAQAAHRWQHPHWCSHQWKQMAMGSSACSQPDGPAVHFTEALCHHSSFSFHLHKICLLIYHGDGFYPAGQENDCMHSWSSCNLDIALPVTPATAHCQNANWQTYSQLFAEFCQGGLDHFL